MDPPDCQLDLDFFEGFSPGEDVLIHAIDQRAIQIEEECWALAHAATCLFGEWSAAYINYPTSVARPPVPASVAELQEASSSFKHRGHLK
jgi:hypothetical protein